MDTNHNLGLILPLSLSGTGFVLDGNRHMVGDGIYGDGAKGIVLAVNSHADLLEALEASESALEHLVAFSPSPIIRSLADTTLNKARSAIAKARGEQGK